MVLEVRIDVILGKGGLMTAGTVRGPEGMFCFRIWVLLTWLPSLCEKFSELITFYALVGKTAIL